MAASPLCGITAGIGIGCVDLRRVGGLREIVWAGNINDLATPFDPVAIGTNFVSSIPFTVYKSLYKIQGPKFAHSAEVTAQVSPAGAVSFLHKVILRIFNDTMIEDGVLQDMSVAEMFFIAQTNNQEFLMYGIGNGMRMTSLSVPTGAKMGDDMISTITLEGTEKTIAKRFFVTDLNTTLAYLNAASN